MLMSGTNTSSNVFTPFTDASFINDCQRQPIVLLHVNHPLFQFADITDILLSTAALFSRYYSHRIQTWAIKAASFLARWIIRFHVQYAIEIGINCDLLSSSGIWQWKNFVSRSTFAKVMNDQKSSVLFLRHGVFIVLVTVELRSHSNFSYRPIY